VERHRPIRSVPSVQLAGTVSDRREGRIDCREGVSQRGRLVERQTRAVEFLLDGRRRHAERGFGGVVGSLILPASCAPSCEDVAGRRAGVTLFGSYPIRQT
jgi:hypothetical protein